MAGKDTLPGWFVASVFFFTSLSGVLFIEKSDWRFNLSVFSLAGWSAIIGWIAIEAMNSAIRRRRRRSM